MLDPRLTKLYAGSAALLAGVIDFIVAARHKPNPLVSFIGSQDQGVLNKSGLSPTVYDLVHIVGWALLFGGVVLLFMGLIDYAASSRP